MKTKYDLMLEELIEGYHLISKTYKWELDIYKHIIVMWHSINKKKIDITQIHRVADFITTSTKHHTINSAHLDFVMSGIICAGKEDPEETYNRMIEYKKQIDKYHFRTSSLLPLSSYILSQVSTDETYKAHLLKSNDVFSQLSNKYSFLTKIDDFSLGILMAASNTEASTVDDYYQSLVRRGFNQSDGLIWLAYVLSLSGRDYNIVAKECEKIFNEFAGSSLRIDQGYDDVLGLLCLLNRDIDQSMHDVMRLIQHMKHIKGFKWLGKDMWVMIAVLIVYCKNMEKIEAKDSSLDFALLGMMSSITSSETLQLYHRII